MPATDAFSILLAHDRWATRQLLAAALPLSDPQLDLPFELGFGSLRATLHHTIDSMRVWSDRQHGKAADPEKCAGESVQILIDRYAKVADEFAEVLRDRDTRERIHMPRRGQTLHAPQVGVAVHVLTHGMHHRAQALNMLRHLGVKPLPKSSVFEWMLETKLAELE